jgi:hypothetical protein
MFTNVYQPVCYWTSIQKEPFIKQRKSRPKLRFKIIATPVTGIGGPQGCETSRLPHLLENRLTDGGEVVSLARRPPFTAPGRFLVLISVRG